MSSELNLEVIGSLREGENTEKETTLATSFLSGRGGQSREMKCLILILSSERGRQS